MLHIEGLNLLRIVGHDYGLLEVLLHKVALMFAGKVYAPVHGEFKFMPFGNGLFEYLNPLRIGDALVAIGKDEAKTIH